MWELQFTQMAHWTAKQSIRLGSFPPANDLRGSHSSSLLPSNIYERFVSTMKNTHTKKHDGLFFILHKLRIFKRFGFSVGPDSCCLFVDTQRVRESHCCWAISELFFNLLWVAIFLPAAYMLSRCVELPRKLINHFLLLMQTMHDARRRYSMAPNVMSCCGLFKTAAKIWHTF